MKYIIESKWEIGKYSISYLKGHNSPICSLALHNNNTLISGSKNGIIKIWNLKKKKNVHTLQAKNSAFPIRSLDICTKKDIVISSHDSFIKLWNIETGKLIYTQNLHKKKINAIKYDPQRNILITASSDETIKIIDFNTYENIKTLNSNQPISCFSINIQKNIIAAGCKTKLNVWDLNKEGILNTISGFGKIKCLDIQDNIIAIGSTDNAIRIIENFDTLEYSGSLLSGHIGKIYCVRLNDTKLISSSADSTIKIWNFPTRHCLNTFPQVLNFKK